MADLTHPSLVQLERLAAALPLPGDDQLAAHVGACAACGARMREVIAERDAFLATHPPAARVAAIAGETRSRLPMWIGALAAAAAVVAMVWWLRGPSASPAAVGDGGTYVAVKGSAGPVATVRIRPRSGGAARPLADAPVAPGDTLVVELDPADYAWAQILSIAPTGAPTVLDELTAPVVGDARTYVVDDQDADRDEQLAVVLAHHPLTAAEVAGALRAPGPAVWVKRITIPKHRSPIPGGSGVSPP